MSNMSSGLEKIIDPERDSPSSDTLRGNAEEEPAWPRTWRAYTSLLGCFFLMFNSWGLVNAYGTFLSYYSDSLLKRYGIVETNLIGATQCFVVLFLSFVVGRLLDADHSRLLMVVGTCFVAVGMFLLSVVNGNGTINEGNLSLIWLLQGLITGIGMACFFVTSSQVAATWFKQRKGFAVGIVASGASIAGLVYPIMLRFLIRSHGFNFAVRMVSTLSLVTCVISILLATPNPSHTHNKPKKWASKRTWVDTAAWKNATFLWFTSAICFLFFGFYAVFFNLEEWAAKNNVGTTDNSPPEQRGLETYYLLAIMNATSTIGRIGSAFLLTRLNALHVHCAVTFLSSLLCFVMWTFARTANTAIAFVVLFGAVSGSVIGLPPASMAVILNNKGERLGQWTGMMYTTSAPFALAGPVIAGALIERYKDHITVQMWSGCCLLISSFCMAVAIYYHRRDMARKDAEESSDNEELSGTDTPRSRISSLAGSISFWSRRADV